MSNFDPRLDKWSESEFSTLGLQFKDAIFNKGRLERERKKAANRAVRNARWKRSWLGRFIGWLVMWFWRVLGLALIFIMLRFVWGVFEVGGWVFG